MLHHLTVMGRYDAKQIDDACTICEFIRAGPKRNFLSENAAFIQMFLLPSYWNKEIRIRWHRIFVNLQDLNGAMNGRRKDAERCEKRFLRRSPLNLYPPAPVFESRG